MVVALAALVLSLTGSAVAAKHYLITSTSQIKPSVLKHLQERPASAAGGAQGRSGTRRSGRSRR